MENEAALKTSRVATSGGRRRLVTDPLDTFPNNDHGNVCAFGGKRNRRTTSGDFGQTRNPTSMPLPTSTEPTSASAAAANFQWAPGAGIQKDIFPGDEFRIQKLWSGGGTEASVVLPKPEGVGTDRLGDRVTRAPCVGSEAGRRVGGEGGGSAKVPDAGRFLPNPPPPVAVGESPGSGDGGSGPFF